VVEPFDPCHLSADVQRDFLALMFSKGATLTWDLHAKPFSEGRSSVVTPYVNTETGAWIRAIMAVRVRRDISPCPHPRHAASSVQHRTTTAWTSGRHGLLLSVTVEK
jgi:hypothetical protein